MRDREKMSECLREQRTLTVGGSITVTTTGLQFNKTGFDQRRKYVGIIMY